MALKSLFLRCNNCSEVVSIPGRKGTALCPKCKKPIKSKSIIADADEDIRSSGLRTKKKERRQKVEDGFPTGRNSTKIIPNKLRIRKTPSEIPSHISNRLPAIPEKIGPYEIIKCLGRGGMGVVYEALDPRLARTVAIKVVKAGQDAELEEVRRFRKEAENVAKLRHPNIVPIYDIGRVDSRDYFTMAYIEGRTLDEWLRHRKRSFRQRAALMKKVADAVHHAHDHGIIHRDLKPENILINEDGEPFVTDFGLARSANVSSGFTVSGVTLGTPNYMSPEQASAKSKEMGPRSDVWSLGAVLYECMVGRPPFSGENVYQTMLSVINEDPLTPRSIDSSVPLDLETICLKCLEKNRRRRYASAADLAEDLDAWISGELIHARPVSIFERAYRFCRSRPVVSVSAILLFGFLVVGGWLYEEKIEAQLKVARSEQDSSRRKEQELLMQERERKERIQAREKSAHEKSKFGLVRLKMARVVLAEGNSRKGEHLLVDAQDFFRAALFENPDLKSAKIGLASAAVEHFQLALTSRNWRQAYEKLRLANQVGLSATETARYKRKLDQAESAQRRNIEQRIAYLMRDAIRGGNRYISHARAKPELISLKSDVAVEQLAPYIASSHVEQQLLAMDVLAWIGGLESTKAMLPYIRPIGANGKRIDFSVQVAAFNAICNIGTDSKDSFEKLRTRILNDPKRSNSSGFASLTHLNWDLYFSKMSRRNPGELKKIAALPAKLNVGSRNSKGMSARENSEWEHFKNRYFLRVLDEPGERIPLQDFSKFTQFILNRMKKEAEGRTAQMYRALLFLVQSRKQDALKACDLIVQSNPAWADAWDVRGMSKYYMSHFKEALLDFNEAVSRDPGNGNYIVHRASNRMRLKDFDGALEDVNRALRLNPKDALAWVVLGRIHQARGQLEEALAMFTKALGLEPSLAAAYANRADIYQNLNDLDKAVADYTKILSFKRFWATAFRGRAQIRVQQGAFALAEEDWDLAIRAYPGYTFARVEKGAVFLTLNKNKAAVKEFSLAIAMGEKSGRPYLGRGIALRRLGMVKAAVADLQKAVAYSPQKAKAHLHLSIALRVMGRTKEALELMKKAESLDAKNVKEWLRLNSEKINTEIKLYAGKILENAEPVTALEWMLRGRFRQNNKRYEAAASDFQKALRIQSHSLAATYALAECYSALRVFSKAHVYFVKAAELAPTNSEVLIRAAHFLLTCLDEDQLDVPVALRYAQMAVKCEKGRNANVLSTLATALFKSGKIREACAIQKEAIGCLPKLGKEGERQGYQFRLEKYEKSLPDQASK